MPHKSYTCITLRKEEYEKIKNEAKRLGLSVRQYVIDLFSKKNKAYLLRNNIILDIGILKHEIRAIVRLMSAKNSCYDTIEDLIGRLENLVSVLDRLEENVRRI